MRKEKKMKGIVLAGGTATRLFPLTITTSKQLLPVYDRQMIFYPLNTLVKAGIKDILIIVAPEHGGQFLNLGTIFRSFGIRLYCEVQQVPRGLADAFILGEGFIDHDNVTMILGDNIFEDNLSQYIKKFKSGGMVFAKEVPDPERFGVVDFDRRGRAVSIEEKPASPKSNYAVTGLYVYDSRVVEIAKSLKPSKRGEIEITDINTRYLEMGELAVRKIKGAWLDAGTFDALLEAGQIAKDRNFAKKFDPRINKAIAIFSEELKAIAKRRLS